MKKRHEAPNKRSAMLAAWLAVSIQVARLLIEVWPRP
jgi:hypothetical protein